MECIDIHMFHVSATKKKEKKKNSDHTNNVVVNTVCMRARTLSRNHGKKLNNFNLQQIKLTKIWRRHVKHNMRGAHKDSRRKIMIKKTATIATLLRKMKKFKSEKNKKRTYAMPSIAIARRKKITLLKTNMRTFMSVSITTSTQQIVLFFHYSEKRSLFFRSSWIYLRCSKGCFFSEESTNFLAKNVPTSTQLCLFFSKKKLFFKKSLWK